MASPKNGKTATAPTPGRPQPRRGANGRRVAVLGGGIAGLTAAHELAERGFLVTVYERKAWGGKARSIPIPGTGRDGRADLPAEHGFRFFPGIYQNILATMERIPVCGNARGVRDNLVAIEGGTWAWHRQNIHLPTSLLSSRNFTPRALRDYLRSLLVIGGAVSLSDAILFASNSSRS